MCLCEKSGPATAPLYWLGLTVVGKMQNEVVNNAENPSIHILSSLSSLEVDAVVFFF